MITTKGLTYCIKPFDTMNYILVILLTSFFKTFIFYFLHFDILNKTYSDSHKKLQLVTIPWGSPCTVLPQPPVGKSFHNFQNSCFGCDIVSLCILVYGSSRPVTWDFFKLSFRIDFVLFWFDLKLTWNWFHFDFFFRIDFYFFHF
jgi:hypothetical protein